MAKGWPCPTSSRTQQVLSPLDVLIHGHGQPRFTASYTAPLVAMVSGVQHSLPVNLTESLMNEPSNFGDPSGLLKNKKKRLE